MVSVYTSQYNYKGEARLDVTIKGNDPLGVTFAPTWPLLMSYRKGEISKQQYTIEYYRLMRTRYHQNKSAFETVLNLERVVFVCFEKPEEHFCHRFMLANIFTKLGATYHGELNLDGSHWGEVDLSEFTDPSYNGNEKTDL